MNGQNTTALDGRSLTIGTLLRLGVQEHPSIEITAEARERVAASWALATDLAQRKQVYGRTTGVGANRDTAVEQDAATDLRLLRSHATGTGPMLDAVTVRVALLIRLNQLLRGGSGIHPDALDALQNAITGGCAPVVHATGAIGTADLSALAEIALALTGEAPAPDGAPCGPTSWRLHAGDALPFLSSNAVTLAAASVQAGRLRHLIDQLAPVAALSFLAVRASRECLDPAVHSARPQRGQQEAAEAVLTLLPALDEAPARRVQDSFGYRAYPQVTGALIDAATALEQVIQIDISAAAENPLIDLAAGDAFHNGNFHGMPLTLALDRVKLALASVGQLSVARLTDISDPEMTGLTSFLADTPGASGMMLLEYNQAAAQDELRHDAQPASLGSAVISRGVENHSSFATQAVRHLTRCVDAAYDVLACELVAGVRALHLRDDRLPPGGELAAFVSGLLPLIEHSPEDRSLTADLAAARAFLAA